MADEVQLWRIGEGDLLTKVMRGKLDLESRLEEWLARDIDVLDPKLWVIGRHVHARRAPMIPVSASLRL